MTRDEKLRQFLTASGVQWTQFDTVSANDAENRWRRIYGGAFVGRSSARQGAKAEHAYDLECCDHYLIVPFTSDVAGLPVRVHGRSLAAYECQGPLIDLSEFHDAEFFVCPTNYAWTMVYTHEDHGVGGPYFHRRAWVVNHADEPSHQ